VRRSGGFRWHYKWLNISSGVAVQFFGLDEVYDGVWFI
jgi:hypothetical protein